MKSESTNDNPFKQKIMPNKAPVPKLDSCPSVPLKSITFSKALPCIPKTDSSKAQTP